MERITTNARLNQRRAYTLIPAQRKKADWQSDLQQDFYVFTTTKGSPDNGFVPRLLPA